MKKGKSSCKCTISELPAFLVEDGGVNSGFMVAHVTAAALASEINGYAGIELTDVFQVPLKLSRYRECGDVGISFIQISLNADG